ncbi:FAD-dependent monooxygenase [Marinobacter sp. NFXS9]|uniref:FAD-dependent monooxygenase n=1 Tax=Marinobacter sp. NFXS9 TaxID=2818433 RepID=UPI0032DF6970
MNHSKRIAIVGAGVAGMALAILATRRGHHVTLFERGREVSSMGAGVTLWPNAVFVLERMGLCDDIQRLGGTPRYMRQFDRHGNTMGEFDIDAVNRLCGFPSVTILRRDLMSALAAALSDLAVDIRFGCSITTQDIDDLKQRYDLVVGADGRMNSVVRQAIYPEPVPPRYQGFVNIIGISRLEDSTFDNAIHDVRGPEARFGIVPVGTDRCFWAGAWRASIDKERGLSTGYDDMDRRFGDWPKPVRQVLQSRDPASLNRIFVHDLDPLPYWHRDNALIIGDAAHAPLPTSGQGACQALEDAWHLVWMLEEHDQLSSALTGFYQRRIAKTSAAQAAGRQVAQQIFGDQTEPQPPGPGLSAERLSHFWMQGLDRA